MSLIPSATKSQHLSGKGLVMQTPLDDQQSFLCWSWSNKDLATVFVPTMHAESSTMGRFEFRPQSLMANSRDLFPPTATTEIILPKQFTAEGTSFSAEGTYLGVKIPKEEGRSEVDSIPLTPLDKIFTDTNGTPSTIHLHRKTGPFPINSYSLAWTTWQGYTVLETEKPIIEEKSVGNHVWLRTSIEAGSVISADGGVISLPDTEVAVFLR